MRLDLAGLAFDTPPGTSRPEGIACDAETLWVIAEGSQRTYLVDPGTGGVIREMMPTSGMKITIVKGYLTSGNLDLPATHLR